MSAPKRQPKRYGDGYPAAPAARSTYETNDPEIKELHDSFDYATDAWRDIRYEGEVDMRYIGGDPWAPQDRAMRENAGRPALSLDELGQYVNQIINDVRQNKRAIKVTPIGNGANDATARLRADLFRQIEYRSNAQQAYTTMFENAVQRGTGYFRIKAQYESATSRHQELLIEPLMNPDLVTPDPDAVKPALEDMRYLFNQEAWSKTEFLKRFPDAKVQSFTPQLQAQVSRWVKDEQIMLAEWWRITMTPAICVYVDVPVPATANAPATIQQFDLLESDFKKRGGLSYFGPGAKVVGSRTADMPKVTMRLTNGIEILEERDWKGRYIPFVGCFGKIIYVDQGSGPEKTILSAIRLARDPYMLYCYYRTAEAELVGGATRFPYFVREGSLSPEEATKLQRSTHEPVAFIQVKATADNILPGTLPEMPQRNIFAPDLGAMELGAEGARRAIQAAMGISPLPTSAQRRNEKSGVALQQIEESAQKGTFHFVDHYDAAIARGGVILDDLVPHYYDAVRSLTVRQPDEMPAVVRVNDPSVRPDPDSPYATDGSVPVLTEGDHDVTISTGPNFQSAREAATQFADTLVSAIPQIAQVSGPHAAAKIMSLSIKLKDIGPIGDEMAEIISPPDDPNALPPQAQAAMAQMQQQNQELQKLADANQTKLTIAQQGDALDAWKAKLESETKIYIADSASKNEAAIADINARLKLITDLVGLSTEERLAQKEHAHAATKMLHESAHELGMSAVEHQQAKDLAEHTAALAPEPAPQTPEVVPDANAQ